MKLWFVAAALLVSCTGAVAADIEYPGAQKLPYIAYSWVGFYIGGHGGYGQSRVGQTDISGPLFGGHLGYNWQRRNLVFGLEGDLDGAVIQKTVSDGVATANSKISTMDTVRARLGAAYDHFLVYGTGGFAVAKNTISAAAGPFTISDSQTHTGWVAGIGLEYAFLDNVSARVEYLHYDLSNKNYFSGTLTPGEIDVDTVRGGVEFLFH